jgi:DNA-binding transcriptional regulator YiaG
LTTTAIEELSERVLARRSLPPPLTRRALREAAGASLADVARACGVTKQAVAQWESGLYSPRGANLLAYAEVLRVFRKAA